MKIAGNFVFLSEKTENLKIFFKISGNAKILAMIRFYRISIPAIAFAQHLNNGPLKV